MTLPGVVAVPERSSDDPAVLASWFGGFSLFEMWRKVRLANAREIERARYAANGERITESRLADLARVDLADCQAALERFKAPDPYSRTKEQGRRIEDADGGWIILNYRKHREGVNIEVRRIQNRDAARRHRQKVAAIAELEAIQAKKGSGGDAP